MRVYGILTLVMALLQRERRVSYWALKQEFGLDEAFIEGLKQELIVAKRVAIDEGGQVLVWTGEVSLPAPPAVVPSPPLVPPRFVPPFSYVLHRVVCCRLVRPAAFQLLRRHRGRRRHWLVSTSHIGDIGQLPCFGVYSVVRCVAPRGRFTLHDAPWCACGCRHGVTTRHRWRVPAALVARRLRPPARRSLPARTVRPCWRCLRSFVRTRACCLSRRRHPRLRR